MTVDEIMSELLKLNIYGHIERNNPRQKVLGFSYRQLRKVNTSGLRFQRGYKTAFTLTVLFDRQTQKVAEWFFDEAYADEQMKIKLEKILN